MRSRAFPSYPVPRHEDAGCRCGLILVSGEQTTEQHMDGLAIVLDTHSEARVFCDVMVHDMRQFRVAAGLGEKDALVLIGSWFTGGGSHRSGPKQQLVEQKQGGSHGTARLEWVVRHEEVARDFGVHVMIASPWTQARGEGSLRKYRILWEERVRTEAMGLGFGFPVSMASFQGQDRRLPWFLDFWGDGRETLSVAVRLLINAEREDIQQALVERDDHRVLEWLLGDIVEQLLLDYALQDDDDPEEYRATSDDFGDEPTLRELQQSVARRVLGMDSPSPEKVRALLEEIPRRCRIWASREMAR